MEAKNLKHAKKHWYKGNLYFKEMTRKEYTKEDKVIEYVEVEMYMGERTVVMKCYNPNVIETLLRVLPQEKIKVWFSTDSHKHNEKWYTNNTIKHIEVARLLELEKMKDEYSGSNGFDFAANNEDF
jgi:hypothetical protein